jgi:hypothetical protein
LWVPHISLVFGEMWEINLLSRVDPPGLFIRTGAYPDFLLRGC